MYRIPPNRKLSDYAFFVTTNVENRKPVFADRRAAKIVLDSLQFFRKRGEIELYGYVIMPNHVHLILKPVAPHTLPEIMRRFKNYVAHEQQQGPIWEKGYFSEVLTNEAILRQKLVYIHDNPVRGGFVCQAEDFEWSSVHEYYGDGKLAMMDSYVGSSSIELKTAGGRQ